MRGSECAPSHRQSEPERRLGADPPPPFLRDPQRSVRKCFNVYDHVNAILSNKAKRAFVSFLFLLLLL